MLPEIEAAVAAMAIDQPAWGQTRVAPDRSAPRPGLRFALGIQDTVGQIKR